MFTSRTFISKKHISRRTLLRSATATLALPLLDAMIPAATALANTAASPKSRMSCIYIPHGATMDLWTPAQTGNHFEFSPILKPLERYRSRVSVISNLSHQQVAPWSGEDSGGAENHVRAAAVFLTGAHPVKGDVAQVGVSVDQVAAQTVGHDTPLPSIELCIEPAGINCDGNFTCAYRNTLSWKSASLPLPMENNPQLVFEKLFGDGATDEQRRERRRQAASLLDSITEQVNSFQKELSATDRARLQDYLTEVREIERRVQKFDEKLNANLALPDAPNGIPRDFEDHLTLMFDLQVLAFKADITRVATLMMARENSNVRFPGSGVAEGFHNASHHSNDRKNMELFARINTYHVNLLADFFKKLAETPDGDGNLFDHSMVLYGSSLSDGNQHNFNPLPVILAGGACGKLQGNRHVKCPKDTPMANLLVSMLHKMGAPVASLGDSSGVLDI